MNRLQTFPFLRPKNAHIKVVDWHIRNNDEIQMLGTVLPHWDPGTDLDIIVTVQVAASEIRVDCGLTADDALRLAVVWYSSGTGLRGCGTFSNLGSGVETQYIVLALTIKGALLSNRLKLETQLVLTQPGKSEFALAAHRSGSLLWHEQKTVILEGQASRFPVEVVDFAQTNWLPENGVWFLDWDVQDLEQMALGGIRLLINSRNSVVRRAVSGSLTCDEAIRESIRFDVARALISGVLDNEEFIENPQRYEDGSVGAAMRRLITGVFPDYSPGELQRLKQNYVSRFECLLQDHLALFEEV